MDLWISNTVSGMYVAGFYSPICLPMLWISQSVSAFSFAVLIAGNRIEEGSIRFSRISILTKMFGGIIPDMGTESISEQKCLSEILFELIFALVF